MIDLKRLDLEYNNYKNISNLYIKYKNEFEEFNRKNSEKLSSLLITYNSIKNIERNSSKQDKTSEKLLEMFIDKNPLFGKWYELYSNIKYYQNKLQQYSCNTQAFMECVRFICLKHKDDDDYDLLDLSSNDKLNLSEYDNDKRQYIINDLKNHHSFICYITQEDLPLLMQVIKEIDKEIIFDDNDSDEKMEQKCWNEITRCHTIATEYEKRKNSVSLNKVNNIEPEKKLIELLGYNLIGPDKSNRWLIMDENNNQVGFIQYKKIFKKNDKKGYAATFGYQTIIDSPQISYNSTRKINSIDIKPSVGPNYYYYELDIKRKNGDNDHLSIDMGEYPSLTLTSKKYGFIDFKADYEGLYLDFKSKTENFNVAETLVFNSNFNYEKKYAYQIKYCDKETELHDDQLKGVTIREIIGSSYPYQQSCNQINLKERTWINGKLRTYRENEVTGTVEELVTKHQMGIDLFNHFRFIINQILPFKQEVVSAMLNDEIIQRSGLSIIIPNLEEELEKSVTIKKNAIKL